MNDPDIEARFITPWLGGAASVEDSRFEVYILRSRVEDSRFMVHG